jgi:hypothetical protein
MCLENLPQLEQASAGVGFYGAQGGIELFGNGGLGQPLIVGQPQNFPLVVGSWARAARTSSVRSARARASAGVGG